MSSPRSNSPSSSPRGSDSTKKATLRTELEAAKKAIEVLKSEKQQAQEVSDKTRKVLNQERSQLKQVMLKAKSTIDELTVEKEAHRREKEEHKADKERLQAELDALRLDHESFSSFVLKCCTVELSCELDASRGAHKALKLEHKRCPLELGRVKAVNPAKPQDGLQDRLDEANRLLEELREALRRSQAAESDAKSRLARLEREMEMRQPANSCLEDKGRLRRLGLQILNMILEYKSLDYFSISTAMNLWGKDRARCPQASSRDLSPRSERPWNRSANDPDRPTHHQSNPGRSHSPLNSPRSYTANRIGDMSPRSFSPRSRRPTPAAPDIEL